MAIDQRIIEAIEAAGSEWFGRTAEYQWPSRVDEHAWSFHATPTVVTEDGQRRELVVKIPRWDEARTLDAVLAAGSQKDTREEWASLAAIERAVGAAGDPGITAIRVYGYVESINAIVMGRLQARPLRARLNSPLRSRGLDALFRRAGRWLRLYHEEVATPRGVEPACEVLGESLRGIDTALRANGPAPEGFRPLLARARSRVEALGDLTADLIETHGDFTSTNVLVAPDGRIASLDPNRYPGLASSDMARLIVDVRTRRGRALTRGLLRPRATIDAWERSFRDGYGAHDDTLLLAALGVAVLQRWVEGEEALVTSGAVGIAAGGLVRSHFRGEAERVLG